MNYRNLVGAALLAGAMSFAANASCIGACGVDSPNGDVTAPPSGGAYSYVTTNGGTLGGGNYPGVAVANGTATNGSTLTTDAFTAAEGGQLSFEFNFITSDGTANWPDFAWAVLEDAGGSVLDTLFTAQTTPPPGNTVPDSNLPANSATLTPSSSGSIVGSGGGGGPVWNELGGDSGNCFGPGCGYTGWIQSLYTITAADLTSNPSGIFHLAFGVSNANDTNWNTGMAIAGEVIDSNPIGNGATPEPSTIVMLAGAMLAMGFMIRRRVSQQ
jgi:hypothetical protein